MSRAALIRQSDVTRIARAAKEAGCAMAEVQIGEVVIRVFPEGKPEESKRAQAEEKIIL